MVASPLRNALVLALVLLAALGAYLSTRPEENVQRRSRQQAASPQNAPGAAPPLTDTAPTLTVEMTAYTSDTSQTDDTPRLTASGALVAPGIAAASRDLLGRFPYGSHVEVLSVSGEGCGGWVPETPLTVADTMSAEITGHLDVWLESNELALAWGRCQAEVRAVPTPAD